MALVISLYDDDDNEEGIAEISFRDGEPEVYVFGDPNLLSDEVRAWVSRIMGCPDGEA